MLKKALIVLSEAIDALGDAFAIYGYSDLDAAKGLYIAILMILGTKTANLKMRWMMETEMQPSDTAPAS